MILALMGYGVVGAGVYELLEKNYPDIIVKYLFLRNPLKAKDVNTVVTDDFNQILEDDSVEVVIELIGGKTAAYTYVKKALLAKKHVVTANKALISEYYQELTTLAKVNNVRLLFEASVGGGIIVLNPLQKMSKKGLIYKIEGIINGSTNYILSKIFLEKYDLDQALEEARDLGYIETGSNDDLEGLDLLRKINILSMISYHQYIKEEDIVRIPLTDITKEFYEYVITKGFIMKYIATSYLKDQQLSIHLEPVILKKDSEYAKVHYEENIIDVYGDNFGKKTFKGLGAGRYPTASAVIFDLLQLRENNPIDMVYDNHYLINHDLETNHFLIQTKEGFEVTNRITFRELFREGEITSVARIDDSVFALIKRN